MQQGGPHKAGLGKAPTMDLPNAPAVHVVEGDRGSIDANKHRHTPAFDIRLTYITLQDSLGLWNLWHQIKSWDEADDQPHSHTRACFC